MFQSQGKSLSAETAGRPWSLGRLFRAYRGPILFTYGLFNLENLLRLAQPWVLGVTIHDLLAGSHRGLLLFLLHQVCYTLVAVSRRRYDTRVFRGIYADFASGIVPEQRRRNIEVSRVAARSGLAREMVDFFERNVPHVMFSLYSVIGATVMLLFYDPLLVLFCLVLLVPVWLLSRSYGRKSLELNREMNDRLEGEVNVIERGCPTETRQHYAGVGDSLIKLSDLEALNFARLQVFIFGLTAAALIRCCHGLADVGEIFAIFGYVMMFAGALASAPQLVQQINRLCDIGRRLQLPELVPSPAPSAAAVGAA